MEPMKLKSAINCMKKVLHSSLVHTKCQETI
jgi:hypothetical protein